MSRRVLLVENHAIFAATVSRTFLGEFCVTTVASLEQARQALATPFDLLLVDYDLDDGKGDALVRELRLAGSRVPIIAISSHTAGNEAILAAGADGVCPKTEFQNIGRVISSLDATSGATEASRTEWQTAVLVEAAGAAGQDRAMVALIGDSVLIALADGAGGRAGGAEAADMVLEMVKGLGARTDDLARPDRWEDALRRLDADICRAPAAGETTAVLILVQPDGVVGASVGDSEAWVVGDVRRILTQHQVRKPMLGSGQARPVGFECGRLEGTLVVGSDGLFKYASAARIGEVACGPFDGEIAAQLVGLARLRSGGLPDDIAVVVCRGVGVATGHERSRFSRRPRGGQSKS